MKKWCVLPLLMVLAAAASAGTLYGDLAQMLAETDGVSSVSTLVYLENAVDILQLDALMESEHMSLQQRHELVVRELQSRAASTQGPLLAELKQLQDAGQVQSFQALWIANVIRVDGTPAAIRSIAARADVDTVYLNYPIATDEPVRQGPPAPGGLDTPEPGVRAVNAPQVWAMGYDGTGVLVSTLDTGVDGAHPALASRWRGLDIRYAGHPGWAWFDPVTHTTSPQAFGAHGTHTMGTVCGGAPGDQVGVAPGAQWIHAAVIDRVSLLQTCTDAILAFQWLIDPDGDPNTNWDVPAVNSNSWGIVTGHNVPPYSTPCSNSFWSYIDACEAAGIVVLFSAGNEGPTPNSLRRPADRATDDYRNLAVAAVDANVQGWPIADFSSRGPTNCTPNGAAFIKPNIAAPGNNVRSSEPGNTYGEMSGTSMASPHVNGVVALLRQACPDLSVTDVKSILYRSAHDLGPAGKDNDYGWGMVDALAAILLAQQEGCTHIPHYGACCNDFTGACTDNMEILDCLRQNGRFAENTLCADMTPRCQAHGACCTPNGCLNNIGEFDCVAQGGRFTGVGTTCPQLIYVQTNGDAFEDIRTTGAHVPEAEVDDNGASRPIGFTFYFYNNAQTNVGVCSNGYLTFGSTYNVYINAPIPHASQPTDQIAAIWRDLLPSPSAGVQIQTLGTAPNRRFITQWTNVPCYSGCGNSTFQIVLFETTNKIELRYQAIAAVGYVAGVENSDGSVGTDVTTAVQPNSSLGLVPQPSGPDPCAGCRGDLNCDGQISFEDINPFVAALGGATPCNAFNADINGDGHVNFDDINPFVDLLVNHSGPCQ